MEQEAAQYWKWMKRKHIMKTRVQAPMMMMKPYDSWEEQAFAEDAAGSLGGCIWPPRSYSCSFCRREFRSAQALGGHMNIHRRERARLKQSLSPQNELDHHYHKNHDDHPNCSPSLIASSSPLSTSRVSASSTLENFSDHTFLSPYSKSSSLYLCTQYYSNSENYTKKDGFLGMERVDCIDTDLSMGLNLVVRHNQPTDSDEDEMISCKKPFLSRSSMEELDLELRLGDPQKVK